jgi:hypothetical protein
LIEKMGERALLAELNVSRQALSRALAGLGVRRGTIALVRDGIASPNLRALLEEHDQHDGNAICTAGKEMADDRSTAANEKHGSKKSRRAA